MRKQRPRGSTTRQMVVEAALTVVDQEGIGALTIRRVATLVGAPPMTLYAHFSHKDELLDLMYAEFSQRLYRDDGLPRWQDQLLAVARRIRGQLLEHPNWAPLLSRPAPPLSVPMRERVMELMVAEGASPEAAMQAIAGVALGAIGFALVDLALNGPGTPGPLEQRFGKLKDWAENAPQEEAPLTKAAVTRMGRFSLEGTFEAAVQALIAGYEASLATARGRTA